MLIQFATYFLILVIIIQNAVCAGFDATELSCLKEFGYDKTIIRYEDKRLAEGDSKLNTFFSCVWKKKGLQHSDGLIGFEKVYEMMLQEIKLTLSEFGSAYVIIKSINDCENVEGNDHGDTAVKTYNCLFDKVFKYISEFQNKYEESYEL